MKTFSVFLQTGFIHTFRAGSYKIDGMHMLHLYDDNGDEIASFTSWVAIELTSARIGYNLKEVA